MKQVFSLEARENNTSGPILAIVQNQPHPIFTVTDLNPGTNYVLKIVSANKEGVASPIIIDYITPIDIAEKRLSATVADKDHSKDIVNSRISKGLIVGSLSISVVIIIVIVIVVLKVKGKIFLSREDNKRTIYNKKNRRSSEEEGEEELDESPDIVRIPCKFFLLLFHS